MLIDTHCHLDMDDFASDRDAVLARAHTAGVESVVTIGASIGGSRAAAALAAASTSTAHLTPRVYATVGIHPESIGEWSDRLVDELRTLAQNPGVVAIGEIGLDAQAPFSMEQQQEVFIAQIELARELNLPMVIHTRKTMDEAVSIIREYAWLGRRAVIHCFSSSYKKIPALIEQGFFISYTGIVTYDVGTQKAVEATPLERLMIETDAPYLAPDPYRGGRCEPAYVVEVAKKVAEIKNVSFDEVARVTTENAKRFFGL